MRRFPCFSLARLSVGKRHVGRLYEGKLSAGILTVVLLAMAAAGCKAGDTPGSSAKPTEKPAVLKPGETPPTVADVAGLPTQKDQVSYMIGMTWGKQLDPIKDEVDTDMIIKGLNNSLAGGKMLLTEEQAQKIGQAFGQKLQQKQQEKMQAAAKEGVEKGKAFLVANGKKPEVKTTPSGLQYQVITAGTGPMPKASDTVRVNYKGELLDGTVFDDSANHGGSAEFPLSQVVPGWKEGIQLMPVGSKYKLWIPSDLGYGAQGTPGGPIPPNATLAFEVELLDIVKPQGK